MPAPIRTAVIVSVLAVALCVSRPAWAALGNFDPGENSDSAKARTDTTLSEILTMVESGTPIEKPTGTGAVDPCTWYPGSLVNYLINSKEPSRRVDADGISSTLYARMCPGAEITWYWIRAADPKQLVTAATVQARSRLPTPRGVFSPDVTHGGRAIVHVPVWFAVDVTQWAPISAVAAVPGLSATVTAKPDRLELDPGDGSPAVSCAGPGQVLAPGTDVSSHAPACSYRYLDASTVASNGHAWRAQLHLHWQITWTATNGDGGTLDPIITTTAYDIPVGEIQALENAGTVTG